MPLLFAVGQHGALEAIHRRMNPGEFWWRSTTMCTWQPRLHRVGPMYAVVHNALEQIARVTHPEAVVWTGSMIPTGQQGIKVLGTKIGNPDFVAAQEAVRREHEVLHDRIPSVSDLQCAWLLLVHCASARACHYLRTLRPSMVEEFARAHDAGLWQCLRNILQLDLHQCSDVVADASTLPLCLKGLGLRSAWRSRVAAHWASWADCLPNDPRQTSRRCSGVVGTT